MGTYYPNLSRKRLSLEQTGKKQEILEISFGYDFSFGVPAYDKKLPLPRSSPTLLNKRRVEGRLPHVSVCTERTSAKTYYRKDLMYAAKMYLDSANLCK